MRTIYATVCLLVLAPAAGLAGPNDAAPPKEETAPAAIQSPDEQYSAIEKEYTDTRQKFYDEYRAAQTNNERQKIFEEKYPKADKFAARFLALAKAHPESDAAFGALKWVISLGEGTAESDEAIDILLEKHLENPGLSELALQVGYGASPSGEKLLSALMKCDDRKTRAIATFAMAQRLKMTRPDDTAALERLIESLAEGYEDVMLDGERSISAAAAGELFEIRHLSIGKEAPDIEGEDLDGTKFQLSDYRGRVVVLDFWGNW